MRVEGADAALTETPRKLHPGDWDKAADKVRPPRPPPRPASFQFQVSHDFGQRTSPITGR